MKWDVTNREGVWWRQLLLIRWPKKPNWWKWKWPKFNFFVMIKHYENLENTDPHCHAMNFLSIILWGSYIEYVFDENLEYKKMNLIAAPDIIFRKRDVFHKVDSTGGTCITLQTYFGKKTKSVYKTMEDTNLGEIQENGLRWPTSL